MQNMKPPNEDVMVFGVELRTKDGGGTGLDCVAVTVVSYQLYDCLEIKPTVYSWSAQLTWMWRLVGKRTSAGTVRGLSGEIGRCQGCPVVEWPVDKGLCRP